MYSLENKVAIVLGGSRGIGAATAKYLARQGADVALTYARSPDRADAVVEAIRASGRKALAIHADAARRGATAAAIEQAAQAFGKLDILVSAAGTFDTMTVDEVSDDRFDASFDLHVRSVFEAARAAVPFMQAGGSLVSIGSIFGERAPFGGLSVYTASKAAEAGMMKALARELGPRNINANSIQPGPINTEMNPADTGQNPMAEFQASQTALGRYGEAEDIAALVAYLSSERGRFITGQAINVDGGWTA